MSPSDNTPAEDPSRPSLEDALTNPGAVKINVQGAYIVDDQAPTPDSISDGDGVHYERKDIRLPHHTSVVRHVAVDVSVSQTNPPRNGSPQEHYALTTACRHASTDRRLIGEAGIFYKGIAIAAGRRPPQFYEL